MPPRAVMVVQEVVLVVLPEEMWPIKLDGPEDLVVLQSMIETREVMDQQIPMKVIVRPEDEVCRINQAVLPMQLQAIVMW